MADKKISTLPDAWRLAMQREQDALDFYMRLAHEATDESLKSLFSELAEEEAQHKARLIREYRRLFEADFEGLEARRAPYGGRVAWLDWTEETFRLARELDLPILLDITGVWCHWCHVMDAQTYDNPEVAAMINAEFIPIRVDTDKRPDINARYNMGGWPTTVILTPAGEALTGRTFVSAEDMLRMLRQVGQYYRENRTELTERLQKNEERRAEALAKARAAGPIAPEIVEDVAAAVLTSFDRLYGGFGDSQKFPHSEPLEFALALYHRTADPQLQRVVELTLTNMATGGIYDHEAGGFFRYSTTRDWTIPHYEKMAEDNAKLTRLYLQAFQVFGKDLYRQTAEKNLYYILTTLYDEARGFFYGSQDAEERYYQLSREERANVPAPYVDKTLYTNWNAMMAMAFYEASIVLNEPAYMRLASRTLDFLWENCRQEGIGMFHYWDGEPHVPGLLTDQIWMARALLHGYQYAHRSEYLQQAIQLMDESVYEQYADEDGVGYFDCVLDPQAPGRLKDGLKNIDENALVGDVSMALYRLTSEQRFKDTADFALTAFGAGYKGYRYFAAAYALVVDRVLRPAVLMTIVGALDNPQTEELLRAALHVYVPNRLVRTLDPTWEAAEIERLGRPQTDVPTLYISCGEMHAEPVSDPSQIAPALAAVIAAR